MEGAIVSTHLLIFALEGQRYALPVSAVVRVVRAAALTPLPKAPEIVLGILDLQGEIIPVINLRKRFRLPERPIGCDDQFLVVRTSNFPVALAVDNTQEVVQLDPDAVVEPEDIVRGTDYLSGVTRNEGGLVLIHDLDTLLFPDEEQQIAKALT
ncbi:scaffold protein CheW associated with MCPs of class 40H [Citrifermentans bemidjiense Bem]|uniref:Scaffold protein CheW associated with MCPs of class 40H n=1 Tax=Citrifermentans bemidjiense (strain ATCC BAA-1014 / DSM 16622 / JCM 12645 / Bem) TaxID=404380 RepID=B5ECK9_CITBB|nr:chemotaxis protein CheW [Citrifermentans bemidjiense]ACH39044.1 scaffold protein CheW associated with MCPs of class 40H [Citrifermentans bemidjiense Bem]